MHPLLARQLNQAGIDPSAMSPQTASLVGQIESAYREADKCCNRWRQSFADGDRTTFGGDDPAAVRPARLLLVDANESDQMDISEMLTGAGFARDVATDAKRAVGAVSRQSYDAVLVDCQTPDVDGVCAIAAIRAAASSQTQPSPDGGTLPILALGAAGADEFLFKPADVHSLVNALNQMLTPPASASASTPTAPAPTAVPPMDLEALLGRCMGDVDFRRRLLEMFPAQFNGCMTKINQALQTGDAEQTSRAAHGLKGAAANLSAAAVQRLAGRIELLGAEGAVADARKLVDELQAEVDRCLAFAGHTNRSVNS